MVSFLIDGLDARASFSKADASTVTTENESATLDAGVGWFREPGVSDVPIVPGFARGVVRALLPGFLEDKFADARLRLTPERVSVGTSYFHQDSEVLRYEEIVVRPDDDRAIAALAPREVLQLVGDVRLRPLPPVTADLTFLSTRDLLAPEDASADQRIRSLIAAERARLGGVDLGWETNRSLRTQIGFRPSILSWVRTDLDWTTVYQSDRNTNFIDRSAAGPDTTLALARNAQGQRDWGAVVGVNPSALATAMLGATADGEDVEVAQLRTIISALRPITVTYRNGVTSRFNRDPVDPAYRYQFGWVDLDDFRYIGADTAATLTDRESWRLASGAALPGGAGVRVGYLWSNSEIFDTRSDRRTVQQTWPDVQATLPTVRLPSFTGIQSINLSSGIVKTRREVTFGGRALQRRFDVDTQVPLDVSIQWLRTLVTSYRGAFRRGRGEDPTGDTERETESHRLSLSTQLLPAGALASRLDRPIRLSVLGAIRAESNCRITVAGDDCVAFVDLVTRTASLSLDTAAGGFEFGIQLSYDDRQSFVGQQTGSTQFQVGLFGQLDFSAGQLPLGN